MQESLVGGPIVTQGTQLERDLGPGRYRTLALIGLDVWLDRPGKRGQVVPSPSPASLAERLHELGKRALFVDFRNPGASQVVPPGRAFEFGAPGVEVHAPAANYDGLVYLDPCRRAGHVSLRTARHHLYFALTGKGLRAGRAGTGGGLGA